MSAPPASAPPLGDLIPPRTTPLSPGRRALYLVGGVLCMIGGVVGWLIPVVTGIPFYIAGAFLLAAVSPAARRGVNCFDRKLPDRLRCALRRNRTADTPGKSSDPGR